jgi:hypothetical protein
MDERRLKALLLAAGAGLVVSGLVPIGTIETSWPPYTLWAWAFMEPFVWPLVLMGVVLICGALLENIRPLVVPSAILLGGASILLFLGTIIAGRKALYDLWFPDQLGPASMLEFHLWPLAIHFSAMLATTLAGLYEHARRWQLAHPESLAPPGG